MADTPGVLTSTYVSNILLIFHSGYPYNVVSRYAKRSFNIITSPRPRIFFVCFVFIMDWALLFNILTVFQFFDLSQSSHVQHAKQRIRAEVGGIIGDAIGEHHSHHHSSHPHHNHNHQQHSAEYFPHEYKHFHHHGSGRRVHRLHGRHRNRWSSGHGKSLEHHHFTGWSAWSACNEECIKRRERFCKLKRKCGFTKHVEERKCSHCFPMAGWHQQSHNHQHHHEPQPQQQQQQQTINHGGSPPQSIIINAAAAAATAPIHHQYLQPTLSPSHPPPSPPPPPLEAIVHHQIRLPVLQDIVSYHHPPQSHEEAQIDDQQDHYEPEETDPSLDELENENEEEKVDAVQAPSPSLLSSNEDANFVENDFFVLNSRPTKYRKQRQPTTMLIDSAEYSDLASDEQDELSQVSIENHEDDAIVRSIQSHQKPYHNHGKSKSFQKRHQRQQQQQQQQQQQPHNRQQQLRYLETRKTVPAQRDLSPSVDDGIDGDTFQYEDFDFDSNTAADADSDHSYEDIEYDDGSLNRNSTFLLQSKEKAKPDGLTPRHRRLYSKWSRWTKCSPKCTTRRNKKCRVREQCGREVLREIAYCYTEGSFCQQWLQAQVQKSTPYELRPMAASRRRDISVNGGGTQSNSIYSDYIMNGKGYRGLEYAPMKLKCGIAPMRNGKRSMYNMLKIIGGKASRKGEWPWQVAIINRFKEAFCGGTLIAPEWVLTAAHCIRKVLYVRLGEHNLDYEDGTEVQLRILKSFKHPNFDKKTVDSDVALLRLPKPVNSTTWIGYSCLPRPYQPLPKNIECTVIGWGKRRNGDAAGTSVLHQADVPIVSMDNCRSVYQGYTITKNMFCAGHKRGRVDTCGGDSGGPLLCRDTTKPNHPWTIFGITSFGDGCAKRNKFGIYAKVPNYVDWVWSVINCNGNCKLHQRNYG